MIHFGEDMEKYQPKHKTLNCPLNKFLVEHLKSLRQAQNLSMRDVVSGLNMPHTIVGKVENMERRLDVIEFIDYCRAINANPVEIFKMLVDEKDSRSVR